ncbi:MAG: triose-phosphate isomerase [Henriciella sp.]|uniref:triose-phosphate isomerase n=1 Tax=Henriciella sp. TaxID=1968823 RepID=UPI0032F00072
MIRPLIAGNWKMNGVAGMLSVIEEVVNGLSERSDGADCLICPPATLLDRASRAARGSALKTGGQDCHAEPSGAHTGDISAEMIADAGGSYVILGHSERRADHNESSEMVASKAEAAARANLTPIICVGETLDEREAGQTLSVISGQIDNSIPETATDASFVVAYEPVWAIGTGKVATVEQVEEVHNAIRKQLVQRFGGSGSDVRILYGGSMKPGNAAELVSLENVNGGLIGGASLKASDFLSIYDAGISNL